VVPALDRLAGVSEASLAISLHAPNDALRDELVPINEKYPLDALMAACDRYARVVPHGAIVYEYVMIEGKNDSLAHADELIALLGPRRDEVKVNLIPFNPFEGSDYRRSSRNRIERFARRLRDNGINTVPRKTRGDDIDAACGQLAGKVADRSRRDDRLARLGLSRGVVEVTR
jgi:23S rRNA (adenine2503-C2)-methyltransferase